MQVLEFVENQLQHLAGQQGKLLTLFVASWPGRRHRKVEQRLVEWLSRAVVVVAVALRLAAARAAGRRIRTRSR